jgi:hypothetical protein
MTFETAIERDGETIELTVQYQMSKGHRGARDSLCGVARGGPPLEPDELPEVTVTGVLNCDAEDFMGELTDSEMDAIEEKCCQHFADNGHSA